MVASLKTDRPKDRRTPWAQRRDHLRDVRRELTAEWHARGASTGEDFRTLTNALFEATFGMDVAAYRTLKGLPNLPAANLRDTMGEVELSMTFLAESLATFLLRQKNARGMPQVLETTRDAGHIAGRTRFELERRLGHVSTPVHRGA